jgi:hypothetical protein
MNINKTLKCAVCNTTKRRKRRTPFPYLRAAKMWAAKKTIATIAHALARNDETET